MDAGGPLVQERVERLVPAAEDGGRGGRPLGVVRQSLQALGHGGQPVLHAELGEPLRVHPDPGQGLRRVGGGPGHPAERPLELVGPDPGLLGRVAQGVELLDGGASPLGPLDQGPAEGGELLHRPEDRGGDQGGQPGGLVHQRVGEAAELLELVAGRLQPPGQGVVVDEDLDEGGPGPDRPARR
jgi:hypothetical protein